jgi:hypothetical protein
MMARISKRSGGGGVEGKQAAEAAYFLAMSD